MRGARVFQWVAMPLLLAATIGVSTTGETYGAQTVETKYPVVQVFLDSAHDQSEFSVAVDPTNADHLVIGSNTSNSSFLTHQGVYSTTNGGLTWVYDTIPHGTLNTADPAVAFDASGKSYYGFLDSTDSPGQSVRVTWTTGDPPSWGNDTLIDRGHNGPDKPHLIFDPGSGFLHTAWLRNDPERIWYARSQNSGATWVDYKALSSAATDGSGANLATGDGTVLYCAWTVAGPDWAIAFCKSFNSGTSFSSPEELFEVVDDLDPSIRIENHFPSMAVDTTVPGDSVVYMVWDEASSGDYDVVFSRSEDQGGTWSTPIRVNQDDSANGKWQYLPWITVGAGGEIFVVFYDRRNSSDNSMTEVWLARSTNGGESFEDFRIGDVAFQHVGVSGGRYAGDYLGLTATPDYAYPVWTDNRMDGVYQAYFAPIPLRTVTGTLTSDTAWKFGTLISNTVTIDTGTTLTIRNGTKVIADTGSEIIVAGHLVIEGGDRRPVFCLDPDKNGSWDGIKIVAGGTVDWGDGCIIQDAMTGLYVDEGAIPGDISGVVIEDPIQMGFELHASVDLVDDTIIADSADYGVYISQCDPTLDGVIISGCDNGIYAAGSSGLITNSTVSGPGEYGISLLDDPESQGIDTLDVSHTDVTGNFTGAHLAVYAGAFCDMDTCDIEADTAGGNESDTCIAVYDGGLELRATKVLNFGSVGVYSHNGLVNLGTGASHGNNSIHTPDSAMYVVHECELDLGEGEGGGETDGGGPPDPEPACEIKAEYNWWGGDPPDSTWFVYVDYNPWLTSDPLGKRVILADVRTDGPPRSPEITASNYPNPFNPSTTIEFSLPTRTNARVAIFNVLGQEVREVADGEFAAGVNRVVWDGRDRRGRDVASGIYLYRVVTNSGKISRKMVLLR